MTKLTHINENGEAIMVDVGDKNTTTREAIASGKILLQTNTIKLLTSNNLPKGDALAVARVAGIMAAKNTSNLIPMCHQLNLSKVQIDFKINDNNIEVIALAKLSGKTGVEMEALTATTIALLTLYDMCKAVDKTMTLTDVKLIKKTGGKSDFENSKC
jgi:molybdenum cofactor biosynthesis protein MoaC